MKNLEQIKQEVSFKYKTSVKEIKELSLKELKNVCVEMGIAKSCPFNLYNPAYYFDIRNYVLSNLCL